MLAVIVCNHHCEGLTSGSTESPINPAPGEPQRWD